VPKTEFHTITVGVAQPSHWEPYVRKETVGATSRYDQQLGDALGRHIETMELNRKN
jgi:hypothetical protein